MVRRRHAINTSWEKPRKHPRHKAPKGMFIGWEAGGHRAVSRAETIGLGGLFLHTPNPLPLGTMIQLLFDLKAGEVRARAIVRYSSSGKGMGVQIVQMQPGDRARLYQFLQNYATAEAESIPSS
jgi:PilZ domain